MASHSFGARRSKTKPVYLVCTLLAFHVYFADCFLVRPTLFTARNNPALFAKKGKKKGGKKGGKKGAKKQSGFTWAQDFSLLPFESSEGRSLSSLICSSFEMHTGRPIDSKLAGLVDVAKPLWKIPACVMVMAEGPGPVRYANLAALQCFGLSEKEFEGIVGEKGMPVDLPSKMEKKYESGYTKKVWRSESGSGPSHDISLRDASRWVLEKTVFVDGALSVEAAGVAYTWTEWAEGNEVVDAITGTRTPLLDVKDVEKLVEEQGVLIRKLKEEDGLGNKDPEVVKEVAKLLELKAMLPK